MLHHLPRIADRAILEWLRLRGYQSRFVPTSTGRIHTLEAQGGGSLSSVLVLHGLSASAQLYENLMRRLRPHVEQVIAADMPGHGWSALPKHGLSVDSLRRGLNEGLDRILTKPTVLFGNSLGGAAAIHYALDRPEKVRALILCAPAGADTPPDERRILLDRFRFNSHKKALAFTDRLFHRPHPARHVLAWGVRQQFARPGIRDLVASFSHAEAIRPEDLARLEMPIYLIWGGADRIFMPSHRSFFLDYLPPHSRIEEPADFGHAPHLDQVDALATKVLSFLHELPAREANCPRAARLSAA
jgi:pimeloyl-ACP methyl ester carboxylesterase